MGESGHTKKKTFLKSHFDELDVISMSSGVMYNDVVIVGSDKTGPVQSSYVWNIYTC